MKSRTPHNESLAGRLLRTVQWVITATAAAATVIVFVLFHNILYSQLDADLKHQAEYLIDKSRASPSSVLNTMEETPQTKPRPKDALYYQIWNAQGVSIAKSSNLTANSRLPLAETIDGAITSKVLLPTGDQGRALTVRFTLQHPDPQVCYITVARPRSILIKALFEIVAVLLLSWVVTIALLTVILPKTLQKGIEPVNQLAQQLAREDSQQPKLDSRKLPSEIRPFAQKIDHLLDNLTVSLDREKRFRADVAHELRNPIAELLVHSEILIEEAEDHDDSQNETLNIAQRMSRLVDALSVIHEAGELHQGLTEETIDIQSMIDAAIKGQIMQNADISIALEPTSTCFSDPHIVRAILDNLLNNAFHYAQENEPIELSSEISNSSLTLRIKNLCEDLNPEDLPNLSLPFWRKESARSEGRHYGLGLSICQAYCDVIGAKLHFAIEENVHFIATLIIPRTPKLENFTP